VPALDLESPAAQRLLLTWQGRHGLSLEQATQCLMAAVAASWAMGVTPELIHAGLETFVTTQQA
jgi:UDP-N-acetylmuramyl pentapeptide synthase